MKTSLLTLSLSTLVLSGAALAQDSSDYGQARAVEAQTKNMTAQAMQASPVVQARANDNAAKAKAKINAPMPTGNPMVGGAPMLAHKDIVFNASKSKDHTTLVAALKAADLVTTLQSKGPFTVFAPTNTAFNMLPDGTVENLLKPENKATLQSVLKYHVVLGTYTAASLEALAAQNGGTVTLTTAQGGVISLMKMNGVWMVHDAKNGMANIKIADVRQSNGVVFVIDKVLMP